MKYTFVLIYATLSLLLNGCCEDGVICVYDKKEVRFLNNSPFQISIDVTYSFAGSTLTEYLWPFQGTWFKDEFTLLPDTYVVVRKNGLVVRSLYVDPCEVNIVLIYDE